MISHIFLGASERVTKMREMQGAADVGTASASASIATRKTRLPEISSCLRPV